MNDIFTQTPIIKIKWSSLSCNIYMKRDDLLPFAFGGNKVRIAYEFFNDMYAKGLNCMIGYGNARSNLSRALATVNSNRGGECHIISPADDDGKRIDTSNCLMSRACGAVFHECNKTDVSEMIAKVMEECKANGLKPYYIYGDKFGNGNEAVPVRAYIKVYREILNQEKKLGIHFDSIVLPTGTGMTHAGLIIGQCLYGGDANICGVSIARNNDSEERNLRKYVKAYGESIGKNLEPKSINLTDHYLCGGYGKYTSELIKIIKEMYITNGIPLDPTYTGKAFYGMHDIIQNGMIGNHKIKHKENLLFIHTGGTPLFFDNVYDIFGE